MVRAVEEIEKFTNVGEKVLVFGVFLRPLRALRDLLNTREELRAADRGRPLARQVAHADVARELRRMLERGELTGELRDADPTGVQRALYEANESYREIRHQAREAAKRAVDAWVCEGRLPSQLGDLGHNAEGMDTPHDLLVRSLVAFMVDDVIAPTESAGGDPTRERNSELWTALASHFFDKFIEPEHADLEREEKDRHDGGKLIRDLLQDDVTVTRHHAELLSGETRPSTRESPPRKSGRRSANAHPLSARYVGAGVGDDELDQRSVG